uniref:Ankyrin repeat domain-containing protein SOWAHC n=1 Tax=Zeugodacus cucurbitae TaxID=28588 RepID=A0A0A1WSM5_ZEUCU
MATAPSELSIAEIRNYMLSNDSKVTNHALVKHFKHFLTKPETQNEARKLFKVYVNILSTIRNENNQKYLILRKKYIHELPSNDIVQRALATAGAEAVPSSPSGMSVISENAIVSPMRQPPPYVPPPEVAVPDKNCGCLDQIVEVATIETSKTAQEALVEPEKDVAAKKNPEENHELEVEKRLKAISKESHKENKENIPRFSFSSEGSATSLSSKSSKDTIDSDVDPPGSNVSVKEATRKFNRLVSEEEAKAAVVSPSGKKKIEEKDVKKNEAQETPEVTMAHKKAKEWIVAMARANYQDLSKLATEYPELVKLHDPFTGYTALHWAAKHGNQDVVKLIAGTHKADVNARTNGGYTPLHISMQFGRADVFELLVNVYKANRDLTDWSGNKPLDYSKQSTSVSPSTFSSEYYNDYYVHEIEPNNNNWARTLFKGASGSSVRNKKYIPKAYATISPNSKTAIVSRAQSLMTATAPTTRRRPKKAMAESLFSPEQNLLEPCDMLSPPTSPTNFPLNKSNNNNNNIVSPGTPPRRPSDEGATSLASGGSGKSGNSGNSGGSGSGSGGATPKSSEKNYKTTTKGNAPRRKESFFRKTLRAAVAGTQTANKPVTNQLLTE